MVDKPPNNSLGSGADGSGGPAANREQAKPLPFSGWLAVLAGALVGLALRLLFWGRPGGAYAAMMASFIYVCPILVGATTVYIAERTARRTWLYYAAAAGLANVLFVIGTLAIMVEGLICAVVIVPLFVALGVIGGVVMGLVCRKTNWPRQTLQCIAVLPLALGGVENQVPTPTRTGHVEHVLTIKAPPERVWQEIMIARDIRPEEMNRAWIFRIGVPLPLAGVTKPSPEGLVRHITMGKDVHFDQIFLDWKDNEYVKWSYRLQPDSFPPNALDDHVLVGGYYFDVYDTAYFLTPVSNGTELRITMGYRVTTQFNWYAERLAKMLLENFEETVLDFYRHRSEAPKTRDGVGPPFAIANDSMTSQ